jgi:hypothetical protein
LTIQIFGYIQNSLSDKIYLILIKMEEIRTSINVFLAELVETAEIMRLPAHIQAPLQLSNDAVCFRAATPILANYNDHIWPHANTALRELRERQHGVNNMRSTYGSYAHVVGEFMSELAITFEIMGLLDLRNAIAAAHNVASWRVAINSLLQYNDDARPRQSI